MEFLTRRGSIVFFRQPKNNERKVLNDVIRAAKSHWGYSAEFLQEFMDKFGLTPDYMTFEQISVLTKAEEPLGVIGFSHQHEEPMLDYFFLRPDYIGQGLGRKMWEQVMLMVKNNRWPTFYFYSDPHAEGFYHHMGAKTVGQFQSFPGRFVPILRYVMTAACP